MNYLAIYNKGLKEVRKEIYDHLNHDCVIIAYSRYPEIDDRFLIIIPFNNIKIKEIKKGTISFIFNIEDVQFQKDSGFSEEWRNTFYDLQTGFIFGRYLNIKKEFLTVTDDKSLNNFLDNIYIPKMLDSELGKKLIEIFKKTDMYKNICDDYKNLNKNYKKFAKSNSHEVEIFTLEFLNNGRIRMIYNDMGKIRKNSYDDFKSLIAFIVTDVNWICEVLRHIKNECKLFGNRSR